MGKFHYVPETDLNEQADNKEPESENRLLETASDNYYTRPKSSMVTPKLLVTDLDQLSFRPKKINDLADDSNRDTESMEYYDIGTPNNRAHLNAIQMSENVLVNESMNADNLIREKSAKVNNENKIHSFLSSSTRKREVFFFLLYIG